MIEIAMLIELTDDALGDTMPIYSGHNSKDWPCVEATHLVLVLEAGSIKAAPRQFPYTEFSFITSVSMATDNNEIYSITKLGNVIFLELDLSSIIVQAEIWVRTSF
jgi:hypothetical protein